MTYYKYSLSIKISTISVAKIFDWRRGEAKRTQITCNDGIRHFQKVDLMGQSYRRKEGQKPRPVRAAHSHDFAKR